MSRLRAWARYWKVSTWWWGPALGLPAIGLRECAANRNEVFVPVPKVTT